MDNIYKFETFMGEHKDAFKGLKDSEPKESIVLPLGISANSPIATILGEEDVHIDAIGSAGCGSGNLIRAMIQSLDEIYTKDEINCYYIDPANSCKGYPEAGTLSILPAENRVGYNDAGDFIVHTMGEMLNKRLECIRSLGARNISDYNSKTTEDKMKPVIIFINETTLLLCGYKCEATTEAIRQSFESILKMGRIAGIHIVKVSISIGRVMKDRTLSEVSSSRIYLQMTDRCWNKINGTEGKSSDLTEMGQAYVCDSRHNMVRIIRPFKL